MRALALAAAVGFAALALAGCGRPFDVKTPPGFVELENQDPWSYRATTPEGIVVAVRVVEDEGRGDIAFWAQAVTLHLRESSGYALLSTEDAVSLDGTKGKKLTFGHDEDGKPFLYVVTLYAAQRRVFILEAGGEKAAFERAQASVAWTMKSVRVKCSTFVSPVLASRTCNRW